MMGIPTNPKYLNNLGKAKKLVSDALGELADLENAIFNQQKAVD